MSGAPSRWINATVVGLALTSLLSDVSHEMATAVLPMYLASLGLGALALGVVEGIADLVSGLAKLAGGIAGQKLPRKKPVTAACYALTALGTSAIGFVATVPWLLAMRSVAWAGRGFRGPLRDVLMADAVAPGQYGRAYGLERAGDMVGAVLGPLVALALIASGIAFRSMLLLALVPGLAAAACVLVLVRERAFRPAKQATTLRGMHAALPAGFWPLVAAILAFGCGDFSRSLLILAAVKATGGGDGLAFGIPVALYAIHNLVSAGATVPAGRAADRSGCRRVLLVGYALGLACNGLLAVGHGSIVLVATAFAVSGVYIAIEETAEKALVAEILARDVRAYGMGVLATANAVGDVVSSVAVGFLWQKVGAGTAFGAAAACSALGLVMLATWQASGGGDEGALAKVA